MAVPASKSCVWLRIILMAWLLQPTRCVSASLSALRPDLAYTWLSETCLNRRILLLEAVVIVGLLRWELLRYCVMFSILLLLFFKGPFDFISLIVLLVVINVFVREVLLLGVLVFILFFV